jgi:hypothetical protein
VKKPLKNYLCKLVDILNFKKYNSLTGHKAYKEGEPVQCQLLHAVLVVYMKKKSKMLIAMVMSVLMICMLCGTAFAADADSAEEVVEDVEVVEAENPVEEAPAPVEEAPAQQSRINSGAMKTLIWALVFIAIGLVVVFLGNSKAKKGQSSKPKKKED